MSPRALLSPEKELTAFAARSTDTFSRNFSRLVRGIVSEDRRKHDTALAALAKTIAQTMTMADLFGRRRLFLEMDAATSRMKPEEFAASPVVPNVTFEEAFRSVLNREPRLAPSAELVAQIYQERHGFALARSADEALTGRIQELVTGFIESGKPVPDAGQIIAQTGDFTRAYADTVYRTNLNTAYTAGRFEQAQEPGVRQILPAMERWSVRDSALRRGRKQDNGENHGAADGLVADTADPIWATHAPPSGYRCRCGVRMVPTVELRRRGLLDGSKVLRFEPAGFKAFRANQKFGRRSPQALIYGGS